MGLSGLSERQDMEQKMGLQMVPETCTGDCTSTQTPLKRIVGQPTCPAILFGGVGSGVWVIFAPQYRPLQTNVKPGSL